MTIDDTDVCLNCGYLFFDEDDYDTLGADGPVCCPDCGNEKFVTVASIITQRDALLTACEKAEPLIDGERINYDYFPATNEFELLLEENIRNTAKVLQAAIALCKTKEESNRRP